MLDGSQVNTLDSRVLIEAVREKTAEDFKDSKEVYILHDPCDIRKPGAVGLEHIGKARSLSNKTVDGYKTFNSVAIDPTRQGVSLVGHTLYSTGAPDYVGQGQLGDVTLLPQPVQDMVSACNHVNTSVLYKKHIKEASETIKSRNPGASVCHISDREFDCAAFFEAIAGQGDCFITRLKLSRLSGEEKDVLTPQGAPSKKKAYVKLIDKKFENSSEYIIPILVLKGKKYEGIRCVLGWESFILNKKKYNVVRITLFSGAKPLFGHPMLLITNKEVACAEDAKTVYKGYLLRFKIEIVFKFLKQNMGWETFRIRDFESIKNLLAIGFFLAGYFKELEEELKKHPLTLFLCGLARSKGKTTLFFILEGLAKLAAFQEVKRWKEENGLTDDDIDGLIKELNAQT